MVEYSVLLKATLKNKNTAKVITRRYPVFYLQEARNIIEAWHTFSLFGGAYSQLIASVERRDTDDKDESESSWEKWRDVDGITFENSKQFDFVNH